MEERIARSSALSTTSRRQISNECGTACAPILKLSYSTYIQAVYYLNDMASADNPTVPSQSPYVFYGGGNCEVVRTLHNIEIRIHVVRYLSVHTQGTVVCVSVARKVASKAVDPTSPATIQIT
jgi:hypothetical protein